MPSWTCSSPLKCFLALTNITSACYWNAGFTSLYLFQRKKQKNQAAWKNATGRNTRILMWAATIRPVRTRFPWHDSTGVSVLSCAFFFVHVLLKNTHAVVFRVSKHHFCTFTTAQPERTDTISNVMLYVRKSNAWIIFDENEKNKMCSLFQFCYAFFAHLRTAMKISWPWECIWYIHYSTV